MKTIITKKMKSMMLLASASLLIISCGQSKAKSGTDTVNTLPPVDVFNTQNEQNPPVTQPEQNPIPNPGNNLTAEQQQFLQALASSPLSFYGQLLSQNYRPWSQQEIQQQQLTVSQDFMQPLRIGNLTLQVPQDMHIISKSEVAFNGQQQFPNQQQAGSLQWTRLVDMGGMQSPDTCKGLQRGQYSAQMHANQLNLLYCKTATNAAKLSTFSTSYLAPQHILMGSNSVFANPKNQNNQPGQFGQNSQTQQAQSRLLINLITNVNQTPPEAERLCGKSTQGQLNFRQIDSQNVPVLQQVLSQAGAAQNQTAIYHCNAQQNAANQSQFGAARWNVFTAILPIYAPNQGNTNGNFQNPNQQNPQGQVVAYVEITYTTPQG